MKSADKSVKRFAINSDWCLPPSHTLFNFSPYKIEVFTFCRFQVLGVHRARHVTLSILVFFSFTNFTWCEVRLYSFPGRVYVHSPPFLWEESSSIIQQLLIQLNLCTVFFHLRHSCSPVHMSFRLLSFIHAWTLIIIYVNMCSVQR